MLIISLIALVGTLCWLVFTFAVYAVPAFVGLSAAKFAYQTGAGALGTIVVGLVAGAGTLLFGQRLIAFVHSPALRSLVTVLFAAPAAFAGYHAVHGLAAMSSPSPGWHEFLSITGAIVIGLVAWSRMSALARVNPDGASPGRSYGADVRVHRNV